MNTVEAMLKIAAGNEILEGIKTLLRFRDREFGALEKACVSAARSMDGLEEMWQIRDRQITADLWFAAGQGMKLNREIFCTPLGSQLLKLDYSDLLREHIMINMPAHREADRELAQMLSALTPQQREQLAPVDEYYAHLETVGLKIAHYLGLRLGDMLYPMTEPGYVSDTAATCRYRQELEQFLEFSLD
jgi:hypothetical protein